MLWLIAVLGNITVIHRMVYTYQESSRLEDAQLRSVQTPAMARYLQEISCDDSTLHELMVELGAVCSASEPENKWPY